MALRHVFFAEREASKIPKLADSLALRTVASVGIVGAGTMGIGIAMSFASAGISVVLHRSEECRVGKECVIRVDLGGRRLIKKKKRIECDVLAVGDQQIQNKLTITHKRT